MQLYQEVIETLKALDIDSTVVVTPTRRLARHLAAAYEKKQTNVVAQTYEIKPQTSWLNQLWLDFNLQYAPSDKIRLNDLQYKQLWKKLTLSHPDIKNLLHKEAFALLASNAWQILQQWQMDETVLSAECQPEVKILHQLISNYKEHAKNRSFQDEYEIVGELSLYADRIKSRYKHIVLFGFDEIVPQMQAFWRVLEEVGVVIDKPRNTHRAVTALTVYKEGRSQYLSALAYAKENHLKHNKTTCIIVPDLTENRELLIECANEVLQSDEKINYTISSGTSLCHKKVIEVVIIFYELLLHEVRLDELYQLLESPFVSLNYKQLNCSLDAYFRDLGFDKISIETVNDLIPDFLATRDSEQSIELVELVAKLNIEKQKLAHLKGTVGDWLDWLSETLTDVLGWPGGIAPNSEEFQVIAQFHNVLNNLSTLEIFSENYSLSDMVTLIRKQLEESIFQVEGKDESIQILGQLEAGGLEFETIWLCDMTDNVWPPAPSPNPLLPIQLQKKFNMPHSSPERELNYAKKLTERYQSCAEKVIFSYPETSKDVMLKVSPLLSGIQKKLFSTTKPVKIKQNELTYETVQDVQGLPFEGDKIASVVKVLQNVSACPFKAYAKGRLAAEGLGRPSLGIQPVETGILLHESLAAIWSKLKKHNNYLEINHNEMQLLIEETARLEIKKLTSALKRPIDNQLIVLELEKIVKILGQHFIFEKAEINELPDKVEEKIYVTLCGKQYGLRADRLNMTAQGAFVIDYKSSVKKISDWFGNRPFDIQLPLYSLANNMNVCGIAYYELVDNAIKIKGVAESDLNISGIVETEKLKRYTDMTTWGNLKDYWMQTANNLAQQYLSGDITINPKNGMQTCKQCDLQGLCRINQMDNNEAH